MEKGFAATKWLLKKNGAAKFLHSKKSVNSNTCCKKNEKRVSKKEMFQRFDENELELHLQSG